MSCLPENGGCERRCIEPFIALLNQLEGSRFEHMACLDRLHQNSRQPDALYSDRNTGTQLVVERKTVAWPEDSVQRDHNDHFIADALHEELGELAKDLPLLIDLEPAPLMKRPAMWAFVREISEAVRANVDSICAGRPVGSRGVGGRWSCVLDPELRADLASL